MWTPAPVTDMREDGDARKSLPGLPMRPPVRTIKRRTKPLQWRCEVNERTKLGSQYLVFGNDYAGDEAQERMTLFQGFRMTTEDLLGHIAALRPD